MIINNYQNIKTEMARLSLYYLLDKKKKKNYKYKYKYLFVNMLNSRKKFKLNFKFDTLLEYL